VSAPIATNASAGVLTLSRRAAGSLWRAVVGLPWGARLVAALVVATGIARSPGLLYNGLFDRDEAYLSVMGDVMRSGGTLYVDVIDRKPPLVPMAYELARSLSIDMRMVRVLCALGVLANGLLVALLVRRLSGSERAAIAGGVLAVLGTAWFLPADAQAANFELWGLAPATGAVLAAVVARDKGATAWRWFLAAGALVAVAAHAKQPYIAAGLPVAFEALRMRAGRRRNVVAGAAGAVLATLPLLVLVDLGDLWRWAWADNADYLDGGLSTARALGVGLGLTVVFLCFHLPLLYGFWAALTRRVKLDPTVLVWALASLAVIPLGLRFFGHYYQQIVPPLAVLSGVALAAASRWAWRLVSATAAVATIVLLVLSFGHRPDLTNFTAIGRYVQQTTSPDDRILVWGALPDVYISAQRRPAGVFLHDGYLTGNWASRSRVLDAGVIAEEPYHERWQLFLTDLAVDPPELVIDAARPGTDWAAYTPSRYPLGDLLEQCYDQVTTVDALPVWRRDHTACPTP
jgi:hypothetical protein